MKAILILIILFGIHVTTLAGNHTGAVIPPVLPDAFFCPECPMLSPKVPLEAPFDELTVFDLASDLKPMVPGEASFTDEPETEPAMAAIILVPDVPETADFTDLP